MMRVTVALILLVGCGGGDPIDGPSPTDPGPLELAVTPGAGVAGAILEISGSLTSANVTTAAGVTTRLGPVGTTTRVLLLLPSGLGRTVVATGQSPDRNGNYSVRIIEVVSDAAGNFAALPATALQAELVKR